MPTANYVTIDGVAYSPGHKKAVAMRTARQHNADKVGEVDTADKVESSAGGGMASTAPGEDGLHNPANVRPLGHVASRAFVSTDEKKLNKTERKFLEFLRSDKSQIFIEWIGIQNITLKLADDCRYTPDFFVMTKQGNLIAYEVKGFWRDDAKVKIKVAARMFPMRFVVVQLVKGQWQFTEVKP